MHARTRVSRKTAGVLLAAALAGLAGAFPIRGVNAADMAMPASDASSTPVSTPTITLDGQSPAAAAPSVPAPSPAAANAAEGPAPSAASIGVLADAADVASHSCTAAVVASNAGDVIVAAAHCIAGNGSGLVFAPGYRNGTAPYGIWDVQAVYADPAWLTNQDPDDDVAFLVVTPSASNPRPVPVQAAVGGFELGAAPGSGSAVQVTGYVSGAGDPVVCNATVYTTSGYPTFDCDGFAGGTSGAPWVMTGPDGVASITAVIGGLNQGGCEEATSYSSPFTAATAALLTRAATNAPADTLPEPGGDGC